MLHSALPGCAECWAQSQLRLSCDQTSAEARDIGCEETSGQYQGDSGQNITGDLISALSGWYITLGLHIAGYPWLVVIWTIISEAFLMWYMRDCGLFICIQLMCPIKVT